MEESDLGKVTRLAHEAEVPTLLPVATVPACMSPAPKAWQFFSVNIFRRQICDNEAGNDEWYGRITFT